MPAALGSNKTKIARRVVEVLQYFADGNDSATVMDIVRRYGHPQSSTSELLSSLTEMGLLYKEPHARSYTPTPRLAALGFAAQPDAIANGRLFGYMDRLAQTTRLDVGLFGIVGVHAQLFRLARGSDADFPLGCGDSVLLSDSAVGLLLLSTLGLERADRILWRLNAEARGDRRFSHADCKERVARYGADGHATGESGFGPGTRITAMLLPEALGVRRLALGVIYHDESAVDSGALAATLGDGTARCLLSPEAAPSSRFLRSMAAN